MAHDEHLARARGPGERPEVLGVVRAQAPTAHVLFADDLPGRRVVVASAFEPSGGLGAPPCACGPAGRRSLRRARPRPPSSATGSRSSPDVVPVVVAGCRPGRAPSTSCCWGGRTCSPPSTRRASRTPPRARRCAAWSEVPLGLRDRAGAPVDAGAARAAGQARGLRRWAGGDVTAGPGPTRPDGSGRGVAAGGRRPFVSAVTGLRRSRLRSRVVLEAAVPGDVFVPARDGPTAAGLAARRHHPLPGAPGCGRYAWRGDGRGEVGPADLETARGIPAEDGVRPSPRASPRFRARTGRFLVVAPGAARAQLAAVAPSAYPASRGRRADARARRPGGRSTPARRRSTASSCGMPTGRGLGAWRQLFGRGDPSDMWTAPRRGCRWG